MMFMIPMPPTSSETAAMAASSVVRVRVPSCWALAISERLRMEKSSSAPSGEAVAVAQQGADLALGPGGGVGAGRRSPRCCPAMKFFRPPWIFCWKVVTGHERRRRRSPGPTATAPSWRARPSP